MVLIFLQVGIRMDKWKVCYFDRYEIEFVNNEIKKPAKCESDSHKPVGILYR